MGDKDEKKGILGAVTAPLEGLSDAIAVLIKKERSAAAGWQITGQMLRLLNQCSLADSLMS